MDCSLLETSFLKLDSTFNPLYNPEEGDVDGTYTQMPLLTVKREVPNTPAIKKEVPD